MNMGGISQARIAEDFRAVSRSVESLKRTGAEVFLSWHGGPVSRKQLLKLFV